jgi:hypothetical protein
MMATTFFDFSDVSPTSGDVTFRVRATLSKCTVVADSGIISSTGISGDSVNDRGGDFVERTPLEPRFKVVR